MIARKQKVEAKTLGDTPADVNSEAPRCALPDAVEEVEAKTLHKRLSDMKDETLVEVLDDTLAKDRGRDTWSQTGCSDSQGTVENAGG